MTRGIIVLMLAPMLAACSLGSQNLSMGYNDPGDRAPAPSFSSGFEPRAVPKPTPAASNSDAPSRNTRVASADGRVPGGALPSGSFETAPKGSLADRDYSGARLDVDEAMAMVNAYRRSKGLKPLKIDAALTDAAKMHSRDLAKWDRISHYGSDGSNPWDRVKRAGFKARLAAENVGTGQNSLKEVFAGWQKSPGHDKNLLLPDATHMGIALVSEPRTEFKTFWTLVIGTPL